MVNLWTKSIGTPYTFAQSKVFVTFFGTNKINSHLFNHTLSTFLTVKTPLNETKVICESF